MQTGFRQTLAAARQRARAAAIRAELLRDAHPAGTRDHRDAATVANDCLEVERLLNQLDAEAGVRGPSPQQQAEQNGKAASVAGLNGLIGELRRPSGAVPSCQCSWCEVTRRLDRLGTGASGEPLPNAGQARAMIVEVFGLPPLVTPGQVAEATGGRR